MAAYFAAPEGNRWSALGQSGHNNKAPLRVAPTSPHSSDWTLPMLESVERTCCVKKSCIGAIYSSKQALVAILESTQLSMPWSIQTVCRTPWIYSLKIRQYTATDAVGLRTCSSQAHVTTSDSSTNTAAAQRYALPAAMMRLQQDAAAAGKAQVTREEACALRAEGQAKYREQLAQQQANLAAADAAARQAAGLESLVGAAAGASSSVLQSETFDARGAYIACGMSDACLVQQQAACSKPSQVSAAAQADVESSEDDYDGIREDDWEALIADPVWAARIAALQGVAV